VNVRLFLRSFAEFYGFLQILVEEKAAKYRRRFVCSAAPVRCTNCVAAQIACEVPDVAGQPCVACYAQKNFAATCSFGSSKFAAEKTATTLALINNLGSKVAELASVEHTSTTASEIRTVIVSLVADGIADLVSFAEIHVPEAFRQFNKVAEQEGLNSGRTRRRLGS
jgi:hypothetical protein